MSKKIKLFTFTISNGVHITILSHSLDSACERFIAIFGEFLFSNVKHIEIC